MESLVKADIFFFISSIATVVLTILVSILLVYLIKAGKNFHRFSEMLKSDFQESEDFILELKERLENNLIFRLFFPLPRRNKHRVTPKKDSAKEDI